MPRRKPTTSVKAILVRDFNWRMGNLQRLLMCAHALDSDICAQVQHQIRTQMDREQFRHEGNLMAELTGNPTGWRNPHLSRAIDEAQRNAHQKPS